MPLTIKIKNKTAKAFWAFAVFYCVGGLLFSQSKVQTFSERIDVDGGLEVFGIIKELSDSYTVHGASFRIEHWIYQRSDVKINKKGEIIDLCINNDTNISQRVHFECSEFSNIDFYSGAGMIRTNPKTVSLLYVSKKDYWKTGDTLHIKPEHHYATILEIKKKSEKSLIAVGQINKKGIENQIWLLEIDTNGNVLWVRDYGDTSVAIYGNGYEFGKYIDVLKDGSIIMAGQTSSFGVKSPPNAENTLNIWVIHTDSIGNVIWDRTFGDVGNEEPEGIFQSQDGNIVLGGNYSDTLRRNTGPVWNQYYLVKMDVTGEVLWEKRLGGRAETPRKLTCIRELPNGDIITSGWYYNYNLANSDENVYITEIILFDKDGNIKWQRQHALLRGLNSRNFIESIIPSQDGGFMGVGTVIPFGADTGNQDIWVLKLNEHGCLHADCSDQKMVLADTIEESKYFTPRNDDFVLFPNPASQTVNIHSKEMLNGYVRVYDVRGAMVFEQKLHKTQRIYLDVSHYAKGLYFVHINDKEQSKTLRFLRE